MIQELVIISGKGGTGKTSVTASFAILAGNAVTADCDVDAADLHLVLQPAICQRNEFKAGRQASIRQPDCVHCGACLARCRFDAISKSKGSEETYIFTIDPTACEGCGVCVAVCPVKTIDFPECIAGEWYVSKTRCGPMVHARLNPGGENSGKLVSKVRETARQIAMTNQLDLILVDGPPGVGCPVIASLTGASQTLIVTEPTLSGAHDMLRVIDLTSHFGIPAAVCINKWDLNEDMTKQIEAKAMEKGASLAGRIQYDRAVTGAQIQGKAVVELPDTQAGNDIRVVWERLASEMRQT